MNPVAADAISAAAAFLYFGDWLSFTTRVDSVDESIVFSSKVSANSNLENKRCRKKAEISSSAEYLLKKRIKSLVNQTFNLWTSRL